MFLVIAVFGQSYAQRKNQPLAPKKDAKVVQVSGLCATADSMIGVPYVRITILNRGISSYAKVDGFFSFAAAEGDSVFFTSVGYRPVLYIIPKVDEDKFTIVQLMTRNDINLPQTIIFPWGDRANFPKYFEDLRLPEDQLDIAKRNLDRERLAALGESLRYDGEEQAEQSLRNRSAQTYYYGQVAPQNIFNPLAWAEFIKAWKNGDFNKKNNNNSNNNTNYDYNNANDLYSTPASTPVNMAPSSPIPAPTIPNNTNVITPSAPPTNAPH